MSNTPTTSGPSHAVPCPFCGKTNDFRDTLSGFGGQQLGDSGDDVSCDHCNNVMRIVKIQTIPHVTVRQFAVHKLQVAKQQQAQQRQVKPGFLGKLLGKG